MKKKDFHGMDEEDEENEILKTKDYCKQVM
jgi:hypothetical protein